MSTATETDPRTEAKTGTGKSTEFTFDGADVRKSIEEALADFKDVISDVLKEGRIRRIVIQKSDGTVLKSLTVNTGVAGFALALVFVPILLAVGVAIGTAATVGYGLKILIEKEDGTADKPAPPAGA